ncbi:alkaline phosphatase family protein [Flammeovirgaceae bacterium SG7u.111]|nr:alkaline phosphatase family protein [Flammeovirgaceae bacterium SG7u.132]WPO34892.1 alkaline phosphatase family protein [Flammeovirgaceae bacterium SG7u.111]
MRLFYFSITLLFIISCSPSFAQKKAVFIILDGIPADVLESVETPTLDEIAKVGGYTRAYTGGIAKGYSETPTISAVGYNSLLTGVWANKHNVWGNGIKKPNYNYWNIFRIAKAEKPEITTAIFSTWLDNRTKLVGEGLDEAGNFKFDYSFDGFENDKVNFPHKPDRIFIFNIDEHVSKEAGRYLAEKGIDLSWVYLEFTDDIGHKYGDGEHMVDAVQKADKQVKRIWDAIKEREEKYGEDWMILITTDHGREQRTGRGHGGQSERERTIWMVTNTKELNESFQHMPSMVDIMPSVLAHMEIEIPKEIKKEVDGISFVGPILAKNLVAEVSGEKIVLTWKAFQKSGKAEFFVAQTNSFKEGGKDEYIKLGKVSLNKERCEFDLPNGDSKTLKVLMKVGDHYLNAWMGKFEE